MAKKLESTFINMVIVLTIVSLVAAYSLASVFNLTKDPIAKAALNKKLQAIEQVIAPKDLKTKKTLPTAVDYDNDPFKDMYKLPAYDGLDTLEIYPAKKGDKVVAYAVKSMTMMGFSGLIEVMVGFKTDGTIITYSILKHAETPGLGTKMTTWFNNEAKPTRCVNGKNPKTTKMQVSKDGGDIDAITAATISSRAFLDAIDRAYKTLEKGGKYE